LNLKLTYSQPQPQEAAVAAQAQQSYQFTPQSMASSFLRQYGPAAIAAGSALFRPMQSYGGEQAQTRARADNLAVADANRVRPHPSSSAASSSSSSPNASNNVDPFVIAPRTTTPSPRPDQSFVGGLGFEQIQPGEAAGYPAESGREKLRELLSERRSSSWWFWSGHEQDGRTPATTSSARKND
jgi:hypothetical protein